MGPPLSLWDMSLWLAIAAMFLLITSELISPYYGRKDSFVNRKRLRNVALVVGLLFLVTVAIRVMAIMGS